MREKIGWLALGLGMLLALAGVLMFIWNYDLRITLTLLVCGVFSIITSGVITGEL